MTERPLPRTDSSGVDATVRARIPWSRRTLLWVLFFGIAAGLGYPILNRYDPRVTPGIIDVSSYGQIISDGPGMSGRNSYRVLQPMVGKPVYWLVKDGIGPWQPVCFALLVSAAAFVATTLVLVTILGAKVIDTPAAWILAPMLYACTFWVPNGMLAGLVDASEACMLAILAWTLLTRRWPLLPVVGLLGALSKETFVPLATAFAVAWWIALSRRERRADVRALAWIAGMALVSVAMPTVVRMVVDHRLVWPWVLAMQQKSPSSIGANFRRLVLDPGLYYPFVWLAPLALPGWRRIPGSWIVGALASAATAFSLALFHDAGGTNVGRAMFNALGVPMSLAAATTLLEITGSAVHAPRSSGVGR
jgi:hypothetical protein